MNSLCRWSSIQRGGWLSISPTIQRMSRTSDEAASNADAGNVSRSSRSCVHQYARSGCSSHGTDNQLRSASA